MLVFRTSTTLLGSNMGKSEDSQTCLGILAHFCSRRYLGPATGAATKGGTGPPSGHPVPRGHEEDSLDVFSVMGNPMLGRGSLLSSGDGNLGADCKDTRRVSGRCLPAVQR